MYIVIENLECFVKVMKKCRITFENFVWYVFAVNKLKLQIYLTD